MRTDRRCVIVGGADINNYEYIREQLRPDDYMIFCDCGLRHLQPLRAVQGSAGPNSMSPELVKPEFMGLEPGSPDLIVGDFDSHENPHLDVETIVLPREKDDTDTVFAVKEAVRRGFDNFLLIGVVGARLDHTLGNVSILLYLDSIGSTGRIIDDYSEMEIVSGSTAYIDDSWEFFSLLNITGCARGITITGAKYPLDDGEITCDYQYGISNEVIPGERAAVTLREGRLLLIKIRRQ